MVKMHGNGHDALIMDDGKTYTAMNGVFELPENIIDMAVRTGFTFVDNADAAKYNRVDEPKKAEKIEKTKKSTKN